MNKVITIHLGGVAYQLEDAGYDALREYLETAKGRLRDNPDRDEILSDIERAIAEKFATRLSPNKNVVLEKEVTDVLAEMGEVADESAASTGGASQSATSDAGAGAKAGGPSANSPRRLYRIHDGAFIAGVCNGIGAYANIDPTFVRVGFIVLTLFWGLGLLVYVAMAFLVPVADSAEQKAAAYGVPATAQEFIRRAKAGYYDAMKSFPDKQARREWKRRFKQDMREMKASFHTNMAANAEQWRAQCGPRHWPVHPGAGLLLPIFSLLHGFLILFLVLALISLFAHGHLLGMGMPVGMPVWIAALLLIFVFGIVTWPLKAARRAYYYAGAGGGPAWALFCLIDVVVWIAVALVCLTLVRHHLPEIRDAIHNFPAVVHDAANNVREWWEGKG